MADSSSPYDMFRICSITLDRPGVSKRLQARFKRAADDCLSKEAAMAFGYMLAQDDMAKGYPDPTAPGIEDTVAATLRAFASGDETLEDTLQIVFGLIYNWVDDAYDREEYESDGGARECLADLFRPYVRPGVVVDEAGLVNPALAEDQAPAVNSEAVAKADPSVVAKADPWFETVRDFLAQSLAANRVPLTSGDIFRAIGQFPLPDGAWYRIRRIATACDWSVVMDNGGAKFWHWPSITP
jgi:hypothetical protein